EFRRVLFRSLEVVQAGGVQAVAVQGGAGQREGFVPAPVFRWHAAGRVIGKVLDVGLVDDVLRRAGGGAVGGPARRVGAAQVNDHAAPAVPAAGEGPGVGGAAADAFPVGDGKVVIAAVQVAGHPALPHAAAGGGQIQRAPGVPRRAAAVQRELDPLRGGRPQRKQRGGGGPLRPQRAVVVEGALEGFGVVQPPQVGGDDGLSFHLHKQFHS